MATMKNAKVTIAPSSEIVLDWNDFKQYMAEYIQGSQKLFDQNNREIQKTSKDIQKYVEKLHEAFGGYTKNEADSLEEQVNKRVFMVLQNKFPNANIFQLKTLKFLMKNKIDEIHGKDRTITEFDGLFIASNDVTYDLNQEVENLVHRKNNAKSRSSDNTKYIIVVESKHSISIRKITDKVNKMIEFKSQMDEAFNLNVQPKNIYTMGFYALCDYLKLADFQDKPLYHVFASPYIKDDDKTFIRKNADTWKTKHNIIVAYMDEIGNDFSISWADNLFTTQSTIHTTGMVVSGGRKKKPVKLTVAI